MALCWHGDDDGRPVVRLSRPVGWLVMLGNMALLALWGLLLLAWALLPADRVDAAIRAWVGR